MRALNDRMKIRENRELSILVPRGRALVGQYQEPRPLARSSTGSPRFTDFPSFCACSESGLTNLIGSGFNLLCFRAIQKRYAVGPGQRSRFLVLTEKSAASGLGTRMPLGGTIFGACTEHSFRILSRSDLSDLTIRRVTERP